jgi:hypothetical protein
MGWYDRPAGTHLPIRQGGPRLEAALSLIWRWPAVSKLEGELAEASGYLRAAASDMGAHRLNETCVPQLVQTMVSAVCFGRLPKTSSSWAVAAWLGLRARRAEASSSSTSRTTEDAAAVLVCSDVQPSSSS